MSAVCLLAGGPQDVARELAEKFRPHAVDVRYHWPMDNPKQWAAPIPDDVTLVVQLTSMCSRPQQNVLGSSIEARNRNGGLHVQLVRTTHKATQWATALAKAGFPRSNVEYVPRTPVIKHWESGWNLTKCGWQQAFVDQLEPLEENECVIFFNNSIWSPGISADPKNPPHRYPPKCRIYYRLGGQTVAVIPKVFPGSEQLDYQHVVNQWLREHFNSYDVGLRSALDQSTSGIDAYKAKKAERDAKKAAKAKKV